MTIIKCRSRYLIQNDIEQRTQIRAWFVGIQRRGARFGNGVDDWKVALIF
ncbi:hypothetical protein BMS3Bbin04_01115 [bacterium BMS3Bbin04]|nr:hypothetical protein BMS3Bbin04_01115 [bacterium BMS3Bbin04]